jgi:uncharacterized membrane protein YebE (DUF533 family)
MTDFMNTSLADLAKAIVADGIVDAAEVAGIRKRIYADGVIDREEADFLFAINDAVSGKKNDPGWKALFVEAMTKHVLDDETSPGAVDDDETDYLIAKIEGDRKVDDVELALLVNIIAQAQSSTEKFQRFVLASMKAAILADGIIDAQEVKMIRKVIYGTGGGGGEGVDRAEADFLFELNDAVSGKRNDPSWKNLFVEAITRHVLDDETSPGEVDDDEAEYLVSKIQADGQVDQIERALIENIKSKAKKVSSKLRL